MTKLIGIEKNSCLITKLQTGDKIVRFSDRDFVDVLDYIYADSQQSGTVTVLRDGIEQVIPYSKEQEFDSLGLEFDDTIAITPKECCNNCKFCFVNQLPEGLRQTLYVKDDDYRLSFISGSYITFTNITEKDLQRIIDYQLSPLYVSVHATEESVRKELLGIKKSPNQMQILARLIDANIKIHAQIVLVPNINDNEILKKSLLDLQQIGISSVAVVPVGLTAFRDNLPKISPIDTKTAQQTIDIVEDFYDKHKYFCYCADEMYQIANREVKSYEYYGDFVQIENGVGLIAKFLYEVEQALEEPTKKIKRSVGLFTGVSGENVITKAKELINKKYPKLNINIYVVKNNFFGSSVTVTGLVTATDIIASYGNHKFKEKYLLVPSVMLKEFETVFLDNMSVKDLSKRLNKKIKISGPTGNEFLQGLIGR